MWRAPARASLALGAPDIHALARATGMPEFLYWKAIFLEARSKGIDDETTMAMLAEAQPAFDRGITEHQLKYLAAGARPFTGRTLSRLLGACPGG